MIGGIPPMVNNSVKGKHLFSQTSIPKVDKMYNNYTVIYNVLKFTKQG